MKPRRRRAVQAIKRMKATAASIVAAARIEARAARMDGMARARRRLSASRWNRCQLYPPGAVVNLAGARWQAAASTIGDMPGSTPFWRRIDNQVKR